MVFDPNKQLPGGPTTVNEDFFDAMVRHQIFLLRMSGGIRNKIVDLLNETENDIKQQVLAVDLSDGPTPVNIRKLERLQKKLELIRRAAWDKAEETWIQEVLALAQAEAAFTAAALETVSPVILDLTLPAPQQLKSIVTTRPFEGKTMREWARTVSADDLARIEGQIRIGMVQGEGSQAIAQRIVGTVRLRGADGVTQIARRNAEAITRTAVNAISNQSRREFFIENEDLFTEEQYVATLDARTTPICRSLDGQLFPVGEGPIPPLHFNCRSLRIAVIDGVELAKRPAKPSTQRLLLKEFTDKEGISNVSSRDRLPRGTKGKFDRFARDEIIERTGTVPGKVTYQEWLTRQSPAFQDEVLGKSKGLLFRKGDLKLDKFVNRKGDELTLKELAGKNKDAFTAAGLDPEDFL